MDPIDGEDFREIAEFIMDDSSMNQTPAELQPTSDEIESVLSDAW